MNEATPSIHSTEFQSVVDKINRYEESQIARIANQAIPEEQREGFFRRIAPTLRKYLAVGAISVAGAGTVFAVANSQRSVSQSDIAKWPKQTEIVPPFGSADQLIQKVDPQDYGNGEIRSELEDAITNQAPNGTLQPYERVQVPKDPEH